jgi:hypothetical protein
VVRRAHPVAGAAPAHPRETDAALKFASIAVFAYGDEWPPRKCRGSRAIGKIDEADGTGGIPGFCV